MSFAATEWEFRARFWFILGVFWLGFLLYFVDHVNVCAALGAWVLGHPPGWSAARMDRLITGFLWVGTLLTGLAALVRTWAGAYLHSSIIHDARLHGEQLVADGPYRHLRNPLYLGNMLLAAGIGMLAPRSGFFVILIGMWIIVYRLIRREEITLMASQGEVYRRYLAIVPRWWPSLAPRVPAGGARPNWVDGFSGEMMMWAATAAMAVFALTKNLGYFWAVFGAGMGFYFLQAYLRGRVKKRPR
jgi:protein-S-isoprenylcysteine O-methyltransferase Ste14